MIEICNFNITNVSRDTILQMVKEEQKVRYSKEIQTIYTNQYYSTQNNPNYIPINIEQEVQKYILRMYGYNDDEESLKEYWKIPSTYWEDEEIKNNLFYMKLNIFKYPEINLEDNLIDVTLLNYKTNELTNLASLQTPNRSLVILAGSMT